MVGLDTLIGHVLVVLDAPWTSPGPCPVLFSSASYVTSDVWSAATAESTQTEHSVSSGTDGSSVLYFLTAHVFQPILTRSTIKPNKVAVGLDLPTRKAQLTAACNMRTIQPSHARALYGLACMQAHRV